MAFPSGEYDWGEALDAAFMSALTTRLITPTNKLPAFKYGLIDRQGKVIREPKTREERRALTYIDRVALLMKQAMGGRVASAYRMYRKARTNPHFLRATARMVSHRFTRYFDIKTIVEPTSTGVVTDTSTGAFSSSFQKPLG